MADLPLGVWLAPVRGLRKDHRPDLLTHIATAAGATTATHVLVPVTARQRLPHRLPAVRQAHVVLDLTERLTRTRAPRVTSALVADWCRLLRPTAVLYPAPPLEAPALPTSAAVWLLGAAGDPCPFWASPVWDASRGWTPTPDLLRAPAAVVWRTADGLPYFDETLTRDSLLRQVRLMYPRAVALLPPDQTPYQLRTARQARLVRDVDVTIPRSLTS